MPWFHSSPPLQPQFQSCCRRYAGCYTYALAQQSREDLQEPVSAEFLACIHVQGVAAHQQAVLVSSPLLPPGSSSSYSSSCGWYSLSAFALLSMDTHHTMLPERHTHTQTHTQTHTHTHTQYDLLSDSGPQCAGKWHESLPAEHSRRAQPHCVLLTGIKGACHGAQRPQQPSPDHRICPGSISPAPPSTDLPGLQACSGVRRSHCRSVCLPCCIGQCFCVRPHWCCTVPGKPRYTLSCS